MKLNLDCVRDAMFYLEEHLDITPDLEWQDISILDMRDKLKYPIQELANTLITLREAGFIEAMVDYGSDRIDILDVQRITYSGYQFIETIRPESVWTKAKAASRHIGSFSLDVLSQVASAILTSMINAYCSGQLNL